MVIFLKRLKKLVLDHKAEFLLICYVLPVLLASVVSSAIGGNGYGIVLFYVMVIYGVFSLVPKIHRLIQGIRIESHDSLSVMKKILVFSTSLLVSLIVLCFWYCGYYPGTFSYDSMMQYSQVISGQYNDWHPALHTIMFYALPLKIWGSNAAIVVSQIVYFSIVVGAISLTIYEYAGSYVKNVFLLVTLLSPFTINIMMNPWKDVAFAMASAVCMILAVRNYFSKGELLSHAWTIVIFALFWMLATVFRHNGILFTLPLLLVLFLFMKWKKWVLLSAISIILLVVVKGPLYSAIQVEQPGSRVLETVGLPLSVIFNVAKECPQCLDNQTADFVDNVAKNSPNWKSIHNLGGFESIKGSGMDWDVIELTGRFDILKMTLSCVIRDPVHSVIGAGVVTAMVFGIEKYCSPAQFFMPNDYGLKNEGVQTIFKLSEKYTNLIGYTPLRWVFCSIGSTIIVVLIFVLFRTTFRSAADWKRALLCIPILTYDFGTMLFLTGDDNVRFFYVNMLVCPLIILAMIGRTSNAVSGDEKSSM